MEDVFKQKLLSLGSKAKPTTFAEALLKDVSWLKTVTRKIHRPAPASEREMVLNSLHTFAEEMSKELKSDTIKVEGGELIVKKEGMWEEINSDCGYQELRVSTQLELNSFELTLKYKIPEKVQVVFVTEKFRKWDEIQPELKEPFVNELLLGFVPKTAELFHRMILAMKLHQDEVCLIPVENDEKDLTEEAMRIIGYLKPEFVVTLGAKATNKILKTTDRLAQIHGQFFPLKVGNHTSIQVVPLFHPSIIETNLNMKKTAWADMQKIMKPLKKLS